jgi:hypothetical protein
MAGWQVTLIAVGAALAAAAAAILLDRAPGRALIHRQPDHSFAMKSALISMPAGS